MNNKVKKGDNFLRLQKFLAHAGIASRRKSEELILQGQIKVNGNVVSELGSKINPQEDVVTYRNKIVSKPEDKVYYMLNKPLGYVTTVKDEKNRKTVIDLLSSVEERIYPVGRLDADTSGLLLLTNDGDLTYLITHPRHEVEKTYIAQVDGVPGDEQLRQFREGLFIDNRKTAKAKIKILSASRNKAILSIDRKSVV